MLRAEENKMATHAMAFSALAAFWITFELKMRTNELKWRHEMSRELGH